ncbi:MAG: HDOD domain-containing protein [Thermodesulfobacteriota bacterium]
MEFREKIIDIVRNKKTQIPTLPIMLHHILSLANDEDTSVSDLADLISKDQAMTNKILRVANSAYYGFLREIDSIQRAITVIGFNEVISLTVGMGVLSSFRNMNVHGIFDLRGLWLHSIGSAIASKELAKRLGTGSEEQSFLSGLLHDTGKIILAVYFPQEYKYILQSSQEKQVYLYQEEEVFFGMDHAALSGLLMERWNFPDTVRLPSRFHHHAFQCPEEQRNDGAIVQFADALCHLAGIGYSGNPVIPDATAIKEFLKINDSDQETVLAVLEEQRPKIEAFFESTNH